MRKNKFSAASCERDVTAKPASVTTSTSRRRIVEGHEQRRRRGIAPVCLPAGLVTLLCQTKRLPAPNRPTEVVFAEHRWVYYLVPSGEILQRHRDRAPVWGYVHMLIVTSIVATGAGLHVAADFIEGRATITAVAAVLAVAVPVGVFLGLMYALSYYLVRCFYVFQTWSLIATAGVVAVTLVAALSGADVARCLVILVLAPTVTVVGSEVRAHH